MTKVVTVGDMYFWQTWYQLTWILSETAIKQENKKSTHRHGVKIYAMHCTWHMPCWHLAVQKWDPSMNGTGDQILANKKYFVNGELFRKYAEFNTG